VKHVCILAVVRGKQWQWPGVSLKALGWLALTRDAVAEAETYFQEALQPYAVTEERYGEGSLYLNLARLGHAQGNPAAVTRVVSSRYGVASFGVVACRSVIEQISCWSCHLVRL